MQLNGIRGLLLAAASVTLVVTLAKGAPALQSRPAAPKGFVQDIEKLTEQNQDFRHVLYTAKNLQLVVMSIPPGQDIGLETHTVDQFFRIEQGTGEALIGNQRSPIGPGSAVIVPAGSQHDFINTGNTELKLYTIYAPPNHRDGVVHPTKADAERDNEHFDGKTTE